MIKHYILFAAAAMTLAGCSASKGEFPSLAKRPIESRSDEIVAATPVPAAMTAVDGATLARVRDAVREANDGDRAFGQALGAAEKAVGAARGAGVGSEAWVAAQMAVSALERARAPMKKALADLDGESRALAENKPQADRTPIAEAMADVTTRDARQNDMIDRLLSGLKSR
jgi:hypothetical protein